MNFTIVIFDLHGYIDSPPCILSGYKAYSRVVAAVQKTWNQFCCDAWWQHRARDYSLLLHQQSYVYFRMYTAYVGYVLLYVL